MKRTLRVPALCCVMALALSINLVSGCGGGWGESLPVVTARVSNQTVIAGQMATFKVAATAVGPVLYQWFKNGTAIPGATSSSYSAVAAPADDGAIFSVNASGAAGTTTSQGVLTVQVPPAITAQPASGTINSGQTATFAVTASGTAPLSYQWFKAGSPITGANSSSLTTSTLSVKDSGTTYTAVVTNMAGSANSSGAVVTISPISPALAFTPVRAQTYGTPAIALNATSSSGGAVTYSVVSGPATVSGNMVTVTGAGTVVLAATQAATTDYTAATAQTSFTVGAQTPSLVFAGIAAPAYGVAPFSVSATSASPGAVTYSVVSGPATIAGNVVTVTGTGTVVLAVQQAATANYTAATAQTSFTVGAETPSLSFIGVPAQTFGATPFAVSASSASSGAVTYSVMSGPATISGSTVTLTGTGVVVLSASQAAAGNYTAATATTSFTVGSATPTLAFATISSETYGNAAFPVTASSLSSGVVTYTLGSGPATVTSSGIVTLTGAGPVTITASQAAAGNYTSATATTTFTVGAATPTLAFATIPGETFGNAAFQVMAGSASPGVVTYALGSGPATVTSNGMVTLTGAGSVTINASQAATANYVAATATTTFAVASNVTITAISPAAQTIAPGQVPFTAVATGGVTNTLTWTATGGTFSGNVWTAPTTAGAYTITATSVDEPSVSTTTTVTVSRPVITLQPVSKNACSGYSPSFNTAAEYATSYQWFLNGNSVGVTTPVLSFPNVTTTSNGTYTCSATNSAGTVSTNAVTLNVVGATTLAITSQPSSVSVYATQTATFSAGVSGTGNLTYQWYTGTPGSGSAITGATSSTYTTGSLTASSDGTTYYVMVSDPDCTGSTVTSSAATLSVSSTNAAVPPTIVVQPTGRTANVGTTATFSVTASGSGTLSYQWYRVPYSTTQVSAPSAGALISGATSSTYTVPASATAQSNDGDNYYVVVNNAYGSAVSNRVVLATGAGILLQVTQQPKAEYVAANTLASFSVSASCTGCIPGYQWYWYAPGATTATALTDGAVSSGALSGATISQSTSSSVTMQNVPATASGGVFYVVVTSTSDGTSQIAGTNSLSSNTAGMFVGSLGAVGDTTAGRGLCNSGSNWVLNGTNPGTANGNVPYQNTSGCTIELTNGGGSEAAAVYWPTLISTAKFSVSFTVALTSSGTPADGFTMVLGDPSQGATVHTIGTLGEGLGANGIPGFVLAFDTYQNGQGQAGSGCTSGAYPCDPVAVPYMAVGQGASGLWENPWTFVNGALDTQNSRDYTPGQFANATHAYVVTVVNQIMTVTMDGYELFTGTVTLPPAAYLGFTASTGGAMESVTFSNLTATVSAP